MSNALEDCKSSSTLNKYTINYDSNISNINITKYETKYDIKNQESIQINMIKSENNLIALNQVKKYIYI